MNKIDSIIEGIATVADTDTNGLKWEDDIKAYLREATKGMVLVPVNHKELMIEVLESKIVFRPETEQKKGCNAGISYAVSLIRIQDTEGAEHLFKSLLPASQQGEG